MRAYLDWNATTPPLPEVARAMADAAASAWGNPSSIHADGRAARARVEAARAAVAALAKVDPRDVVLTSGGTEANNIALRSAFFATSPGAAPQLVASRLEHPSVTRVAEALEREGRAHVRWLRVTPAGGIDLDDLEDALASAPTRLVALQSVNHETGVVQPTREAARLAREHGAILHIDAVQAWGKVAVDESDGDTRALAGHKIRGPKGIGALLSRPGIPLFPCLLGGAQERGLRPGTADPVAAAGLTVAAERARSGVERYAAVRALRDRLERGLVAMGLGVNGAGDRAPHVTNVWCPGFPGPELVAALDLAGVSVSAGSACSAGTNEPSPGLEAMLGVARAACSVRVSLGDATTDEEVALALRAFARVLPRARGGGSRPET
jgi:cysteine desulfurase